MKWVLLPPHQAFYWKKIDDRYGDDVYISTFIFTPNNPVKCIGRGKIRKHILAHLQLGVLKGKEGNMDREANGLKKIYMLLEPIL